MGVDGYGEPNGAVNEDGRYLINPHSMLYVDLAEVAKAPERVPQKLNSVGITGIMDAMASPDGVPVYDKLYSSGKLTVRITLAQFYDPSRTRTPDGKVDYASIVSRAKSIREHYAGIPSSRPPSSNCLPMACSEGNPFSSPPNSAQRRRPETLSPAHLRSRCQGRAHGQSLR